MKAGNLKVSSRYFVGLPWDDWQFLEPSTSGSTADCPTFTWVREFYTTTMRQNNLIHRNSARHDRHQPGCIWGLLRIFDFRQRHSAQRLISDQKRGSGANEVIDSQYSRRRVNICSRDETHKNSYSSLDDLTDEKVSDETVFSEGSSAQVPMKTLIANEISMDNYGDHLSPDSERRIQSKVRKKKNKTSKMVHNFHSDDGQASKWKSPDVACPSRSMEQFPGTTVQGSPVDRFYDQSDYQQSQLENKIKQDSCHDVKHIPNDPTEDFIYQKFYDAEFLSEDAGFQHSKESMDALEILNSNKELFLKLLQDPNSLLAKHIQGLKSAEMEQISLMKSNRSSGLSDKDNVDRGFSKQSLHRLSRIRQKLWGKGSSLRDGGASQNSTKIVVLKPGTAGIRDKTTVTGSRSLLQSKCDLRNHEGEALPSSFSLKEIKRKLKLAISDAKAEQRRISVDGVLHKIPYGYQAPEELCRNDDEEHLTGESSDVPKKATRHLRSQSWKERTWRPLRPQGVIVDEWSILSGLNYLENKKAAYSRSLSQPRESAATGEAKRHFSEILDAKNDDECLFTRPTARTLGRVFSLPDHILSSPRLNPWRENSYEVQTHSEHLGFEFASRFSREKVSDGRSSPNPGLELENPTVSVMDVPSCNQTNGVTPEIQELNPDSEHSKGLPGVSLTEEVIETEETHRPKVTATDERRMELADAHEEGTSKTKLSDPSEPEYREEQFSNAPDVCTCSSPEQVDISMDTSIQNSAVDMTSDDYPPPSTSCLPLYQAVHSNICEKLHEPSPVSVLESAISEDISSPDVCFPAVQAEILIKPRKIHFEELEDSQRVESLANSKSNSDENGTSPLTPEKEVASKICPEAEEVDFEYVRILLEASKLTLSKEGCPSWDVSDQPLDPSLFFLVDPPDEVSIDQLLFFDCVNEVLLEISQRSSGCQGVAPCCKPRVRPFPAGENLIKEVWSGLKWHVALHTQDSRTLEKLVERDLAKSSWWMDLTSDAEALGVEVEVTLLEELIEETVTELVR